MVWFEYLLPLLFLFPLAATGAAVLTLRHLLSSQPFSPFDTQPLDESGQTLRERLDRCFVSLFINGALGPILILSPLVYGMGRMLFASEQIWLEWAMIGALISVLALVFGLRLIRDFQKITRLKLGLSCELAVGEELKRLIRPESHPYVVFKGLPGKFRTLGHVVVTPNRVFVIETRARTPSVSLDGVSHNIVTVEHQRLRFGSWNERRPMQEALQSTRWLAVWLERELRKTVPVQGVLVLPGWQVVAAELPAEPHSELWVVSGEGLAGQLRRWQGPDMDPATHREIIAALQRRQEAL
ncbi:nuclease-related domain-containing protein [Halomonas halocynthiae]|uniref:nuclease-related domain-containing protein n=1 Tax=Halomonas halocynthiae TaxID=176290 RepID=UPI00042220FC|nr:nuclease-related domain-containing protein [Halomonas halocynthiae]